jgi:hypothetical protein
MDKLLTPYDTIVSYFDSRLGPSILVSNTDVGQEGELEREISSLMDLHRSGSFFVHYHGERISANYIFSFKSEDYVRGGYNDIMISFVFKKKQPEQSNGEFLRFFFSSIDMYENQLKFLTKSLHRKVEFKNLLTQLQNPTLSKIDSVSFSKLQLLKMLHNR